MQTEYPQMGRRVLRRPIWGYSVCLCPIKGTPGLNELILKHPIRKSHSTNNTSAERSDSVIPHINRHAEIFTKNLKNGDRLTHSDHL